jgi:hypothetical protein
MEKQRDKAAKRAQRKAERVTTGDGPPIEEFDPSETGEPGETGEPDEAGEPEGQPE